MTNADNITIIKQSNVTECHQNSCYQQHLTEQNTVNVYTFYYYCCVF